MTAPLTLNPGRPAQRVLGDTLGMGFLVWAIGYAMGFVIISLPGYPAVMQQPAMLIGFGLLIAAVTGGLAFWRFRPRGARRAQRALSWRYAAAIGASWLGVAIVCDFLFIVLLFNAWSYYRPDIAVYYALTLVVPPIAARLGSRA
jgi:hypothetical protein